MRGCVIRRVLKDGTERYAIKWTTPAGKQCYKTVGTKRQAQRALVAVLGEMDAEGSAYRYSNAKFSEYLAHYLQVCEDAGMKPSTIATYRNTSKRLVEFFGNTKMREGVTVSSTQAFISARLNAGDTPKTVNKVLWLLSGICESAVNEGVMPTNVVTRVKKPRVLKNTERAILTPQEVSKVLRWVVPEYRSALTVLAMTALRPSELCGLIYDTDIDHQRSELIIQRACWRSSIHPFAKQNKIRRVPFSSTVRDILVAQRATATKSKYGTVFSGRAGGLLDARVLNDAWKAGCKRAGVALPEGEDTIYVLRHSALSGMLSSGADPVTVASIAGHSVRTLLAVYTHAHRDNAHDAMQRLAASMTTDARDITGVIAQSA